MKFDEIATISGKGGLFRVLANNSKGMILESMDEQKKKVVVKPQAKLSILSKISMYTTGGEETCPLEQALRKIHKEFEGNINLTAKSDPEELKAFLKQILPTYDEQRVYLSDIKKLVSWYRILSANYPEVFEAQEEESKASVTGDTPTAPGDDLPIAEEDVAVKQDDSPALQKEVQAE